MKKSLLNNNITVDHLVNTSQTIYNKTSEIIHTCYRAFLTSRSHAEYIIAIKNAPFLTKDEKRVLSVLGSFMPVDPPKHYFC